MTEGNHPDSSGISGCGSARESACDAVLGVMAWYVEQLAVEQRRPAPDSARVEELLFARRAVRTDLERAKTALFSRSCREVTSSSL